MPKGVAKRGRKERRPNLTPKEERGIVEYVLRDESRQKSREKLAKEINRMLPEKEKASELYLKKRISEIRSKEDSEGEPWTIGAKVDISHEALPVLLRCWKEAQLSESSFTIREAKWCARLSTFIKDSWTLRSWAGAYANREMAYEIMQQPLDTSDFDTILTTPPWELVTGYLTGEIKPVVHGIFRFDKIGRRVVPIDKLPAGSSGQWQYPVTPPSFMPVIIGLTPIALYAQAHSAEIQFLGGPGLYKKEITDIATRESLAGDGIITPLGELNFSQEQVRVYTLWLQYFAKGPLIKSVAKETDAKKGLKEYEKRLQIAYKLRIWVQNHELAQDSSCLLPNAVDPDFLDYLDTQHKLKPVELLKKVGYEA